MFVLPLAGALVSGNGSSEGLRVGQGSLGSRWSQALGLEGTALAQINVTPRELESVDVVEHLGERLPLGATFRDSDGNTVRLGDFADGKRPTLLVFAYHTCPMLCSLVLDATLRGLKGISWTVGKEFDVVSVSIDPRDTPETAARKRAEIVKKYDRTEGAAEVSAGKGWHFLVGDEANIRQVTNAVGFQFRYDERQGQYAHPAAIFLVTPSGNLARYLYGIQFDPQDLRLGLLEASEGRSISTVERLLLYCYHYDPQGKRYALVAMRVMRIGGLVTMTLLGTLLGILWRSERRKNSKAGPATPPNPFNSPAAPTPSESPTSRATPTISTPTPPLAPVQGHPNGTA
jgi:protein SCO1/2